MKSLGDLEKFLDGLVNRAAARVAQAPAQKTLLEIRTAILRDVQSRIEPAGRGKFVFPYNRIAVTVFQADAAQVEGFFGDESLAAECRELLEHAGCAVRGLAVEVKASSDESDVPFRIDYGRETLTPVSAPSVVRPALHVTVITGAAAQSEYSFDQDRINIGRGPEVLSNTHGVLRVNDVVFDISEKAIGREHAYLRYDAATGRYRLHDDRSGDRGTRLFRDGRSILVTRAGSEVKSGDEIHLGVVRLRLKLIAS
jgi:hypothetical protein